MRWQSLTTLAASLMLSAACTGDFSSGVEAGPDTDPTEDTEDGPDEGATARALFDGLHSQLVLECQSCHLGPGDAVSTANGLDFLGADPQADAVYAYLLQAESLIDQSPLIHNSPANSRLYYYGSVLHTGAGMTPGLQAQVESWIIAEAEEDGITPDPEPEPDPEDPEDPEEPASIAPKTVIEAIEMFATCMRYEDFVAGEFPEIADINTNNGEGRCYECHGGGESGAYLADDPLPFFLGQRSIDPETGHLRTQGVGIFALISAKTAIDGTIDIIQTKRYELKQNNNGAHPNFNFDYEIDVENFYQATYQHYQEAIATGIPCTLDAPQ